jgi:RNA polymerase sigma factor (sigma-70 family)
MGPELTAHIEAVTPRLLLWARLRLWQRNLRLEPEDLVQEVWCRVLDKAPEFSGDRAAFEAWALEIGKYILLEQARRSRRVGRVQLAEGRSSRMFALGAVADTITTLTRKVARDDEWQRFLAEVEKLDPDDQKLLLLCGVERLRHADVAIQLGLSKEAVTKRWQRLRDRISLLPWPQRLGEMA